MTTSPTPPPLSDPVRRALLSGELHLNLALDERLSHTDERLLLPAHLDVRRSRILGAGMGLFARRRIRNRRRIGKYRGTYFANRAAIDRPDCVPLENRAYLMDSLGDGVVDGGTLTNHMRWANHSDEAPNAYARLENDGVIFFIALRDIEPGEEILIDYGYDPRTRDESLPKPAYYYYSCFRCPRCGTAGNLSLKKIGSTLCLCSSATLLK